MPVVHAAADIPISLGVSLCRPAVHTRIVLSFNTMHVTQEASEIDAMREAAWNEDRLGQEAELRRVGQNQVPFKEFRAL